MEAHYHQSCRRQYTREIGLDRSRDDQQRKKQIEMEQAHRQSFDKLCSLITERVLVQQEIMKLSDALQYYVGLMNATEYQCPDYRAEKVIAKLLKHDIGSKISFTSFEKGKGKYSSQLIFSNAIETADAVKLAYKLGTNDSIAHVAETLRESIKESFINSDKMSWPPSVEYLKNIEGVGPEELERFLKIVLSGSKYCENIRVNRLGLAISQDICRRATNGKWTMPKHILLCMTLRHTFCSKELLTLINKFGHCEGYNFSFELETAIAKAVQESVSLLFCLQESSSILLASLFFTLSLIILTKLSMSCMWQVQSTQYMG